jgi:murein DD-endopeptidase MepM/ murein hydrolase activator NlpD
MRFYNPWPAQYNDRLRSNYGPRVHPITGERGRMHHGIDVALPSGTPLTAPADGVVVNKGFDKGAGFFLVLEHAGGWRTVFFHLQKTPAGAMRSPVKVGDVVAYSGNTGASTGPHLHFEVRRSATRTDTVDPMQYLAGPYQPPQPEPVAPVIPAGVPVNRPEPVRPPITGPGHGYGASAQSARPGMSNKLRQFFNTRRNLK